MGIFSVFSRFTDAVVAQKQGIMRKHIIEESITCRCGGPAIPVFNTSNKYYCLKCESRFANARHRLTSKINQYDGITHVTYDKVVDKLRSEI